MDCCPLIDLPCQSRWWDMVFLRRRLPVTHLPSPWNKLHTSPTYLSLCPQVTPASSDQALPLRSEGKQCPDFALSIAMWKNHRCGCRERPSHLMGSSLVARLHHGRTLGTATCPWGMIPALLPFLLSCERRGPVCGGGSNMVNPCSTLSVPFQHPPNHILMNIRIRSFLIIGSSCEKSHLSKDGAPVLGPKAVFASGGLI